MAGRTPAQWFIITQRDEKGWYEFYKELLKQPISQPDRFFKAVETLGHLNMFNAVVSASLRKLSGDPLSYVIGIAMNKSSDDVKERYQESTYEANIEEAKKRTLEQNKKMEIKLEKAREIENV